MLFFERQKTLRGEWPKTFSRDSFPENVRIQCWQLADPDPDISKAIVLQLRLAIGCIALNKKGMDDYEHNWRAELGWCFLRGMENVRPQRNVEYALSILELLVHFGRQHNYQLPKQINDRLRLGGVGYKICEDKLIPIDDEHLTETAIIPAVSLLNQSEFSSSYAYLHQAFLDYREGTPKSLESAIDNTIKAQESLLKHIFDQIEITYNDKDTYMPLVLKAKEHGMFPNIDDDKLAPLMNQLKGAGSLRNREGGHGAPNKKATDRLVRLAIHHATANMLYIAETYLEEHKK